jgi:hypothetical protein
MKEKKMSEDKYLVIEYTDAAGGWAGNRYITGFSGEERLESLKEDLGERQKVIAHDVTMDEAQLIVSDVHVDCLVAAAFEECTIEGVVEPMMLKMQLQTNAFAAGENARMKGIPAGYASVQYGLAVVHHINTKIADIGERHRILEGINSDSF